MTTPDKRYSSRIYLSVPHMGGAELQHVGAAFASNWLSTIGPQLTGLENRFQEHLGRPCLAVASGTAAIHLCLRVLGIGPGDEVVVPTLTFAATANPVIYQGGRPVFLDSETTSWNLDPNLLADFLAKRARDNRLPKAVIVVHLLGSSADMDAIMQVCGRYQIPVIEDAAEALGACCRGRPVGSISELAAFSFNGNKTITGSTGGLLAAADPHLVELARHLSTQARDPSPCKDYIHTSVGYNYRMSNVVAGVVLGQFGVLPERVRARQAVMARYRQAFADWPAFTPMPEPPWGASTHWLSCFQVDEQRFGASARELVIYLEAANVEARPLWKPLHTQPVYAQYECVGGRVAESLSEHGLCLPSSSSLPEEEIAFVIERLTEAATTLAPRRG